MEETCLINLLKFTKAKTENDVRTYMKRRITGRRTKSETVLKNLKPKFRKLVQSRIIPTIISGNSVLIDPTKLFRLVAQIFVGESVDIGVY